MSTSQPLAEPLSLPSGLVLKNRLAKAAMSENLADTTGAPSDRMVKLYERLGRGGAGLLISGNAMVDAGGRTERHNVVMVRDHAEQLRKWASAARAEGSALFMQLSHAGRQTARTVTWSPVAPSAVRVDRKGGLFSTPNPLTEKEIEVLIGRFGRAAAMAETAGFDGVQIHGAHGYLVSQFLSGLTNQRTDGWGGSLDARMRFLLEVVRATRKTTGPKFSVAVKLNSADFQRGGFTFEESMQVAQALEAEGIDLLEISGGSYEKPAMTGSEQPKRASTRAREAFFLEYAIKMRDAVGLPLMVTGGFRSRNAMNEAIDEGATDVIGIARPVVTEPDLFARLVRGEADGAVPLHVGVGVKLFDDVLQIQWFQRQLKRMGRGAEPDPSLSRWGTIVAALTTMYGEMAAARFSANAHALQSLTPKVAE